MHQYPISHLLLGQISHIPEIKMANIPYPNIPYTSFIDAYRIYSLILKNSERTYIFYIYSRT